MSFTKRIINGARSGINSVVDKIAADDTPLSHVDEDGFQRELAHRIEARKANPTQPGDNKRVNMAGASEASRQRRVNMAEKRAAKIHGIRERRARAAEKEQEEAFRRAKAQAQRASARRSTGARSSSAGQRSRSRAGGGFPFQRKDDKIIEYYKVLDLEYGASFDEVKKAYRKLMRKYHPDRHVGNPKKQKAATELTMRVTQAYNALEEHLKDK